MIKKIINQFFGYFGFDLIKRKNVERKTMSGILKQISKQWQPDVVVDVGAAFGEWSKECYSVFPKAKYVLLEPLEEYNKPLTKVKNKITDSIFLPVAACPQNGKINFHVHEDLVGSSLKNETEGPEVDGKVRIVEGKTLDNVCSENELQGNFLIKIDVQGAELDVLRGAQHMLANTQCVILEVSFFKSFVNAPDVYEVIIFMKEKGFVIYDIGSFLYRPYDGALSQTDMVFVRETSILRKFHGYATPEQRNIQNDKFKKQRNSFYGI